MSGSNGPRLTADLLAQPAVLAARLVAESRLDACVDAAERLDSGAADALHDLRVSLRRLRTWLRTFRPFVDDTVGRKSRRRLRRLVRSTNSARDLEVWSAWIAAQPKSERSVRAASRYALDALSQQGEATNAGDVARVRRRLQKLSKQLRVELTTYSLHTSGGLTAGNARMSDAAADALRQGCSRLWRRIARIESENDIASIHRTRIAAKNLRYLIETLDRLPAAAEVATALSGLQDELGIVHDMQLLVLWLLEAIEAAGAANARHRAAAKLDLSNGESTARPPAGVVVGLIELASRAQRLANDAFAQFRITWDEAGVARVDGMVTAIVNDFERSARESA